MFIARTATVSAVSCSTWNLKSPPAANMEPRRETWLSYTISQDRPEINVDLQWFKKSPCRLPEAFWFGFIPLASEELDWKMEKLGKWISPLSVVENGNRHLHAVGKGVKGSAGRNMLAASPRWIQPWWLRERLRCWTSITPSRIYQKECISACWITCGERTSRCGSRRTAVSAL